MREFHEAVVEMEPVAAQAGGDVDLQLVTGRPQQPRNDTQRGMQNVLAVRGLLQRLGFFAGETCCMDDLSETQAAEDEDSSGGYEKVTHIQAMNILAGVCRTVLERFKRTQEAASKANGAPAEFIRGYVELGEEKGRLAGSLAETEEQLVKAEARKEQLEGEAAALREKNAALTTKLGVAEAANTELAEEKEALQTTIGKQRLLIGALLGALALGGLGVGAGAFACHKAGVFDRVAASLADE